MSEGFVIENGKANFVLCARCGAAIKNVFYYQNKPYGSECIEAVTGRKTKDWYVECGVINEEKTATRDYEKFIKQAETDRKNLERIKRQEALADQAKIRNAWIIDQLNNVFQSDFIESVFWDLERKPFTSKYFGNKIVGIISDIIGKNGGRRGSKKFNALSDKVWDIYEELYEEEI